MGFCKGNHFFAIPCAKNYSSYIGATALDVSTGHVTTFGGPGSQHVFRFSADWHPEWTSKCMGDISNYATLPGGGVAFSERFVFHASAIVPQADN